MAGFRHSGKMHAASCSEQLHCKPVPIPIPGHQHCIRDSQMQPASKLDAFVSGVATPSSEASATMSLCCIISSHPDWTASNYKKLMMQGSFIPYTCTAQRTSALGNDAQQGARTSGLCRVSYSRSQVHCPPTPLPFPLQLPYPCPLSRPRALTAILPTLPKHSGP